MTELDFNPPSKSVVPEITGYNISTEVQECIERAVMLTRADLVDRGVMTEEEFMVPLVLSGFSFDRGHRVMVVYFKDAA